MALSDCSDPGGHDVELCEECGVVYCLNCRLSWYRPGDEKKLYPVFYWPGKGYVQTGGCVAFFDAGESHVPLERCH